MQRDLVVEVKINISVTVEYDNEISLHFKSVRLIFMNYSV